MHFDDLPVFGGSEAHAVLLHVQVGTDRVELGSSPAARVGIGVVQQPDSRPPNQPPSRPESIAGDGKGHEGVKWLPVRQQHKPQSSHNTEAPQAVGQYMPAAGFENERLGAPAGSQEIAPQA